MRDYNALSEMQTRLLANDIIDLVGNVDGDMAVYVREAILRAVSQPAARQNNWPELLFPITTNGGEITAGFDIYDLIKTYPGHTIGRVYAGAHSIGAIILQACDVRQCLPHAGILIHNPKNYLSWDERNDPEKLQEKLNDLDRERQNILEILSQRIGQTIDKIAGLCAKAKNLTAQ